MIFSLANKLNDVAVLTAERKWSYGEVNDQTKIFADFFIVKDIHRVLIHLPQSFEAYCLIVAAFISGTTFCPVNVDVPEMRLKQYIDEFDPDLIITATDIHSFTNKLVLQPAAVNKEVFSAISLTERIPAATHLAYVIFTSGSTGQPKGVKISRSGFLNFLSWSISEYEVHAGDIWGQYSNIGFDLSICDIFTAFYLGVTLTPIQNYAEKMLPGAIIKKHGITFWHSVPSVIDLLYRAGHLDSDHLSSLRIMTFCGEKLYPSQLELLFKANPALVIYNTYGPTEGTVFCTFQKLTIQNYRNHCDTTVALGSPIPNYQLKLINLEDNMGEIVIISDFIGEGYLGNVETSGYGKFISKNKSEKAYYTGDYAYQKSNQLYYQGRKDRQVKVRGNRIDLSEIDHCLRRYGCKSAVSTVVDQKIISFVIDPMFSDSQIRTYLNLWLPPAFIPQSIVPLTEFCYNSNQKADIAQMVSNLQLYEHND